MTWIKNQYIEKLDLILPDKNDKCIIKTVNRKEMINVLRALQYLHIKIAVYEKSPYINFFDKSVNIEFKVIANN